MANECSNFLKATGEKAVLEEFHSRMTSVDDKGFSFPFRNFVPIPAELESQENFNWRSWCVEHWGTKWDPRYLGEFAQQEARVAKGALFLYEYSFLTAWSPPEKWLEKASEQSPGVRLDLYYFEPGLGFAGYYSYLEGECLRNLYVSCGEREFRKIGLQYFQQEYQRWLAFHDKGN